MSKTLSFINRYRHPFLGAWLIIVLSLGDAVFVKAQYADHKAYVGTSGTLSLSRERKFTKGYMKNGKLEGETALGGTLFGGYRVYRGVRTEVELFYNSMRIENVDYGKYNKERRASGDLNAFAMLAGFYGDLNRNGLLRPYVGAGLGLAMVSGNDLQIHGEKINVKDNALAWQLTAGLALETAPNWMLFLDYRYFGTDSFELSFKKGDKRSSTLEGLGHHMFRLGIKFRFSP